MALEAKDPVQADMKHIRVKSASFLNKIGQILGERRGPGNRGRGAERPSCLGRGDGKLKRAEHASVVAVLSNGMQPMVLKIVLSVWD